MNSKALLSVSDLEVIINSISLTALRKFFQLTKETQPDLAQSIDKISISCERKIGLLGFNWNGFLKKALLNNVIELKNIEPFILAVNKSKVNNNYILLLRKVVNNSPLVVDKFVSLLIGKIGDNKVHSFANGVLLRNTLIELYLDVKKTIPFDIFKDYSGNLTGNVKIYVVNFIASNPIENIQKALNTNSYKHNKEFREWFNSNVLYLNMSTLVFSSMEVKKLPAVVFELSPSDLLLDLKANDISKYGHILHEHASQFGLRLEHEISSLLCEKHADMDICLPHNRENVKIIVLRCLNPDLISSFFHTIKQNKYHLFDSYMSEQNSKIKNVLNILYDYTIVNEAITPYNMVTTNGEQALSSAKAGFKL